MDIRLPGQPLSTNSIYRYTAFRGYLRGYMSSQGHTKKDDYAWQFKGAVNKNKDWKTDGLYEVEVKLFFKDKRAHDIDNYNKLILDAASGIVWDDDKQIMKLTITKAIDKEFPRAEVVIHSI